jgi:hypothetical protein
VQPAFFISIKILLEISFLLIWARLNRAYWASEACPICLKKFFRVGKWLIIPDIIVAEIKTGAQAKIKEEVTPEKFSEALQDFISTGLEARDKKLYEKYKNIAGSLSSDKIKRALNGRLDSNGVFVPKNQGLLDILCWYSLEKNWKDILRKFSILEDKINFRTTGANEDDINEEIIPNSEPEILSKAPKVYNQFSLLDDNFWQIQKQANISNRERVSYLANLNSSSKLLPKIIVNEYYVKPPDTLIKLGKEREELEIDDLFNSVENQFTLVKIADSVGQGKSTFCLHLAFVLKVSHFVLLVNNIEDNEPMNFPAINEDKPILFLVDDCSKKPIYDLVIAAKNFYKNRQIIVCLFDQTIRYKNIARWSEIREEFDDLFTCSVPASRNFFEKTLTLLLEAIQFHEKQSGISNNNTWYFLKQEFLNSNTLSLVDKIYSILEFLGQTSNIKYSGFDWQVWDQLTKNECSLLKNLFCIVATYFQFGRPVPLGMFKRDTTNEQEIIIQFLSADTAEEKEDYPILIENDHLALRHEYLAKHYFSSSENHKDLARRLFTNALQSDREQNYVHLFRNIYWHDDFENSFLIEAFYTIEAFYKRCIVLFEQYLKCIDATIKDDELEKTQMELAKLYYLFDKNKSFELLQTIINNNEAHDVHGRTLLAGYYTLEGLERRLQALELILDALKIRRDNYHTIWKIAPLFFQLSQETKFSFFEKTVHLYKTGYISLKSLCVVAKEFYMIAPSSPQTLKLIEFLEGNFAFSEDAHNSWLQLQAAVFLDKSFLESQKSYIIFHLAKRFIELNQYTKTLKLFLFSNEKFIKPQNRIQLINCYFGMRKFNKAQRQLNFFKFDERLQSHKIYLLKQAELYYQTQKCVLFLKTVTIYTQKFELDAQFEEYATYLHRNYFNPYDIKTALYELEQILEYAPYSINFRALLFYLACQCDDLSIIKKSMNSVKVLYIKTDKERLISSLLQLRSEARRNTMKNQLSNIIKRIRAASQS